MSDPGEKAARPSAAARRLLAWVADHLPRPKTLAASALPAVLAIGGPLLMAPDHAGAASPGPSRVLCQGWRGCDAKGFTSHGYAAHFNTMFWRMFAGSECTNYTAFVESSVFHVATPYYLLGNGGQWAVSARIHGILVNHKPSVGAVAEWDGGSAGIGPMGHVAVVEEVGPGGSYIVISQQNIGAEVDRYDWTLIRRGFPANQWQEWPSNFIHFRIPRLPGAGYYDPRAHTVTLRDVLAAGPANATYRAGSGSVVPLLGNWAGSGRDTSGFYLRTTGTFVLSSSIGTAAAGRTRTFGYGPPGMIPLAGNWKGRRADGVGYYDPKTATFHLRAAQSGGPDSFTFTFGPPGMIPLAGNWTGGRTDGVGYYDPRTATFHLRNRLSAGRASYVFHLGPPRMIPLVGNWFGGLARV